VEASTNRDATDIAIKSKHEAIREDDGMAYHVSNSNPESSIDVFNADAQDPFSWRPSAYKST